MAVGDFDRDGKPDLAVANGASSTISILGNTCPFADLTITKTHPFALTQSQFARYIITASNIGTAPTSGTVTVTDALPAGLTQRSLSGLGWTCNKATLTCTRGDALAGASAYQDIELDVIVSSNAPASVTNTASVSGGADIDPDNNTASDPANINVTVLGPPTNLDLPVGIGNGGKRCSDRRAEAVHEPEGVVADDAAGTGDPDASHSVFPALESITAVHPGQGRE